MNATPYLFFKSEQKWVRQKTVFAPWPSRTDAGRQYGLSLLLFNDVHRILTVGAYVLSLNPFAGLSVH